MKRILVPELAMAAAALLLGCASVSGAGLLGQRYAAVSYDQVFVESAAYDDGDGISLLYNQPLCETVDLGGRYSYLAYGDADGRDEVGDFSDQRIQLLATAFGPPELDRIWVRVGAGLGIVEKGDDDTTNLCWSAEFGTEYQVGEKAVLQPYAGWSDVLDDGFTTRFVYGLQLVFQAGQSFGAKLQLQGDHDYNLTVSLGAVARF